MPDALPLVSKHDFRTEQYAKRDRADVMITNAADAGRSIEIKIQAALQ